jgi:hypothetical protein
LDGADYPIVVEYLGNHFANAALKGFLPAVPKPFPLLTLLVVLSASAAAQSPLSIPDQPVPAISTGSDFRMELRAAGGVPPYTWSIAGGDPPAGLNLSPDGCFCGRPLKPGEFTVTIKVEDSAHPAHSITKDFHAAVAASLLLEWLEPPKVRDNRIDGSVKISNGSKDTYDLTVVIEAVAENGRATAIGYEHFNLKPGDTDVPIKFGNTMPPGAYAVNADAIAEIPARNNILRQRLQTPQPLKVVAGP